MGVGCIDTAPACKLPESFSKVLDKEKRPTFRLVLVEISGAEALLFVCLKDSQDKEKVLKSFNFRTSGGDKRDRTAVVCLPERLSKALDKEKRPTFRLVLVEISGIEPLTS